MTSFLSYKVSVSFLVGPESVEPIFTPSLDPRLGYAIHEQLETEAKNLGTQRRFEPRLTGARVALFTREELLEFLARALEHRLPHVKEIDYVLSFNTFVDGCDPSDFASPPDDEAIARLRDEIAPLLTAIGQLPSNRPLALTLEEL